MIDVGLCCLVAVVAEAVESNILSTATWPLLYTQNPSLIILVLGLVHPATTRLTARLVNNARDAVSIRKPRRCSLNKPRRANRIRKLARCLARAAQLD